MGFTRLARRNGLPLTLAAAAAIAWGVVAVTISLARRDMTALPGAVVTLLLYGTFGYFALRGHDWARWLMFTLVTLTAVTCTFFAFFNLSTGKLGFGFTPVIAAVSVFFAIIAIGTALPRPRVAG